MPDEFSRALDRTHTSGPQDLVRLVTGSRTRLVHPTRPEGRVPAGASLGPAQDEE